jgi:hypothetical protein
LRRGYLPGTLLHLDAQRLGRGDGEHVRLGFDTVRPVTAVRRTELG